MPQWLADLLNGSVFLETGIDIWNFFSACAYGMLSADLKSLGKAGGTSLIGTARDVYELFLIVGASLMTMFFLVDFVKSTSDIKHGTTLESTILSLMKLAVSEAVMVNAWDIILLFLKMEQHLIGIVAPAGELTFMVHLDTTDWEIGLGNVLAGFVFGIVLMLLSLACGLMLVYTVYSVFLKVFYYIAIAPLALSTMAGPSGIHGAQQTVWAWLKALISALGELAGIVLVMRFGSILIQSGGFFDASVGILTEEILHMVQVILCMILITGGVRVVDSMNRRAFSF